MQNRIITLQWFLVPSNISVLHLSLSVKSWPSRECHLKGLKSLCLKVRLPLKISSNIWRQSSEKLALRHSTQQRRQIRFPFETRLRCQIRCLQWLRIWFVPCWSKCGWSRTSCRTLCRFDWTRWKAWWRWMWIRFLEYPNFRNPDSARTGWILISYLLLKLFE